MNRIVDFMKRVIKKVLSFFGLYKYPKPTPPEPTPEPITEPVEKVIKLPPIPLPFEDNTKDEMYKLCLLAISKSEKYEGGFIKVITGEWSTNDLKSNIGEDKRFLELLEYFIFVYDLYVNWKSPEPIIEPDKEINWNFLRGVSAYTYLVGSKCDYTRYLDLLSKYNTNLTRYFMFAPWINAFPYKKNGKYDLNQWNEEYFVHLKKVLEYAKYKGIVIMLSLFDICGLEGGQGGLRWDSHAWNSKNNINGYINASRGNVVFYDRKDLYPKYETFVRKVCDIAKDYPVIIEIGNEIVSGHDFERYFGRVVREYGLKVATCDSGLEREFDYFSPHGIKSVSDISRYSLSGQKIMYSTDGGHPFTGWPQSEWNMTSRVKDMTKTAYNRNGHFESNWTPYGELLDSNDEKYWENMIPNLQGIKEAIKELGVK